MAKGSIDIVMVENSDGIGIQYFPITKQTEAEAMAKKMSEYHQKKFTCRIKNVPKSLYPHLGGIADDC